MKLTHGFKGLEITISWSFDILFRHNSSNYFPPAILRMLSRLTTLASVSGQSRYALTPHLRISQTHLSIKCQFIGETKWRDPNNQNFRKFRSKTQWIGSVQAEKFRKTGPPFGVNHFSRSDTSEFWLNGSRHQGPHSHILMTGGSDRGSYFIPQKIPTSEFFYQKKFLLFLAYPKKSLSVFVWANFIIYLLES